MRRSFSLLIFRAARWLPRVVLLARLMSAEPVQAQSPAPASNPSPTTEAPLTMEASFDFTQGVILLDVDISGGHVIKLVLDTGDQASVIDLDLAKELKLPFEKLLHLPAGTKGPDISTPQFSVAKTRIGDTDFEDKPFLVLPISEQLKAMGITCQGTIGYRFFEAQVVQIDYQAHKLRVLPAMPPPPAGVVVVPIQWKQYLKDGPYLLTTDQFKVGEHPVVAQFDTLFARTMILFTTRLPWLESRRLPDLPSAFYEDGVLRAALPSLPVALGSHLYAPTPPAYLADKDAHLPETDIAAVLGNVFFLDAVVTLDYKKDRMMVEWKGK